MSNNLDSTILTGFQQGDERAFRRIFDHFYPALYNFTQKLTGNHEEAKDISLHAFQKLFERCKLFETVPNIKAFLYITCRNRSLDYLYAQKRQQEKQQEMAREMSNDTLLRYEYDIMDELVDRLNAAIENLPEENRKIFKLLYYEQMTPAEIADLLRISVQTVYTQRSRAIRALRLMLADNSLSITWLLYTIIHVK
ncbi:RNA polymerase sigma factor [Niastella caeni]|nr:sigma-70 family RNA polymerase sigma factor [Niastella caeni]